MSFLFGISGLIRTTPDTKLFFPKNSRGHFSEISNEVSFKGTTIFCAVSFCNGISWDFWKLIIGEKFGIDLDIRRDKSENANRRKTDLTTWKHMFKNRKVVELNYFVDLVK